MKINSINPTTGDVLETFVQLDDQEIENRIQKSYASFLLHRDSSFALRAEKMRAVSRVLRDKEDEYAAVITKEMGKLKVAAKAEIRKCADLCLYYADNAELFLKDHEIQTDAKQSYMKYLPLGPVLAVMPWNFPFWQVFRFAVPAMMAGNVALLKHASNVPGCAVLIEDTFRLAGFENDEFQSLLIGSEKVEQIIADDRIKAVTLTGSEKAGASVASIAGKHIKKAVLELGGSDPFIVMPSADIVQAVSLAVKGRVQNNGQTCIAAKRYIVHQDIYDDFKERIVQAFQVLNIGDPMEDTTDIGPLATENIRSELDNQVQETLKRGATLLCGAKIIEGDGYFYRPGLMENIPEDSPAYKNELFGPVGLLFKIANIEEAIELANDTKYGLGSVICTKNPEEIEKATTRIDAGCTFVNAIVTSDQRLPFGGTKASGYGRELSAEGIREFTNIKTVVIA